MGSKTKFRCEGCLVEMSAGIDFKVGGIGGRGSNEWNCTQIYCNLKCSWNEALFSCTKVIVCDCFQNVSIASEFRQSVDLVRDVKLSRLQ